MKKNKGILKYWRSRIIEFFKTIKIPFVSVSIDANIYDRYVYDENNYTDYADQLITLKDARGTSNEFYLYESCIKSCNGEKECLN